MKRILIAVAALGLMAGPAVAMDEMSEGPALSFSGSAGMALTYMGQVKDGATVTHESEMTFNHFVKIGIAGSGTTDGGLTFGADVRINTTKVDDADVFIGGDMWTLTVGTPDRASDLAFSLGDVGWDGNLGVDDVAEGVGKSTGDAQARFDLKLGSTTLGFSVATTEATPYTKAKAAETTSVMVDTVSVAPGVDAEIELVEGTGTAGKPAEYVIKDGTGTPYTPGLDGQYHFTLGDWDGAPSIGKAGSQKFVYANRGDLFNDDGKFAPPAPSETAYTTAFDEEYDDQSKAKVGDVLVSGNGSWRVVTSRTAGKQRGDGSFAPANLDFSDTKNLNGWGYDGDFVVNPDGEKIWNWNAGDNGRFAEGGELDGRDAPTDASHGDVLRAFWIYDSAFRLGADGKVGGSTSADADTPHPVAVLVRDATETTAGIAAVLEKVDGTGVDGIPAQYRLKDGTGTAPVVTVNAVEREIVIKAAMDAIEAQSQKTHWGIGVKSELGPVTLGLGADSNDALMFSVGGSRDGFGGSFFYGRRNMDESEDITSMGAEGTFSAGDATSINVVYAQSEMGNVKMDGFGVGVTHDLGGKATVQAGLASVNDRDKFSAGVTMSF